MRIFKWLITVLIWANLNSCKTVQYSYSSIEKTEIKRELDFPSLPAGVFEKSMPFDKGDNDTLVLKSQSVLSVVKSSKGTLYNLKNDYQLNFSGLEKPKPRVQRDSVIRVESIHDSPERFTWNESIAAFFLIIIGCLFSLLRLGISILLFTQIIKIIGVLLLAWVLLYVVGLFFHLNKVPKDVLFLQTQAPKLNLPNSQIGDPPEVFKREESTNYEDLKGIEIETQNLKKRDKIDFVKIANTFGAIVAILTFIALILSFFL